MKNKMFRKAGILHLYPFKSTIALITGLLLAAILIGGCNSGGNADNNGVDSSMDVNDQKIDDSLITVNTNEADFLVKAANGGMTEVQAGQIAEKKATNEDVKKFASKMVEDHSKLNEELKSLAGRLNVTIPASIDADSQSMLDKLNNTKAVDFNKTYMDMMVEDHNKDVDLFEKFSRDAANPDIHGFATDALPILTTHQQMAKKIQESLK